MAVPGHRPTRHRRFKLVQHGKQGHRTTPSRPMLKFSQHSLFWCYQERGAARLDGLAGLDAEARGELLEASLKLAHAVLQHLFPLVRPQRCHRRRSRLGRRYRPATEKNVIKRMLPSHAHLHVPCARGPERRHALAGWCWHFGRGRRRRRWKTLMREGIPGCVAEAMCLERARSTSFHWRGGPGEPCSDEEQALV